MQIKELLDRFGEVEPQADGGYLAVCAAHADSHPSLRIWVGEDRKVRLTCRAGCETRSVVKAAGLRWRDLFDVQGDDVDFVPVEPPALVDGRYLAALGIYAAQCSDALTDDTSQWAEQALDYVATRFGMTEDVALAQGLGVDPGGSPFVFLSDAYRRFARLTVPLRGFDGTLRGLQGRDLTGRCPGRWLSLSNPKGFHWVTYGVFRGGAGYEPVIITEGPSDGLTVTALGYDAVAIRGAAIAGSPELIAEIAEGVAGRPVILAGDSDRAGKGFNAKLMDGLQAHGVQVASLAVPAGDVTDWREANPGGFATAFHAAVSEATPAVASVERQRNAVSAELATATGAAIVSADQGAEAGRVLAQLVERYGESDAMNAHALVAWTGGRIRWAKGLGFYVWTGKVWQRSEVRVRQEIHRMGAALVLSGKLSEAKGFTMTTRIDALMTELRSVPSVYVEADAFDARPDLLAFANGVVELRTGVLREHRASDMLTYALAVDYDPSAKAPRWEEFVREVMPGMPEMPAYLQRLVGYGITGRTDEQCFAVLHGKGANGKSVFTDTLTTVFSAITQTTGFATFEDKASGGIPNDLAALRGARLVMASEGDAGKPMSEAVLKRVTGKDRVTARFLRQEFFTFQPTFLIMLATNHKPSFRGQDEGLWRRVKLVPFKRWFAPHERDHDLDKTLLSEAAGIIAWAVRGAQAWYAEGLQDPDVITRATREYRETSDALAGFFPGVLVRDDSGAQLDGAAAYTEYRDWCEAEGLSGKEVWTRRAFYGAMDERGIQRKKTNRGQALIGVRVASAASQGPNGPGIFDRKDG